MTQNENNPAATNDEVAEKLSEATSNSIIAQPVLAGPGHQESTSGDFRKQYRATAWLHGNQAQIAYRFAGDHGHLLKYAPGLGWMTFDEQRWVPGFGKPKRLLLKTLRDLRKEAKAKESGALAKLVKSCESRSGLEGVLSIAASLEGIEADVEDFDRHPQLLNMPNGTLDLRSREVHPHNPGDLLTKITLGSYDPAKPASSPLWNGFLQTVLPDPEVRHYNQQVHGLSLYGSVLEHIFVVMTGSGRNGKGVCYGAVSHAFGEYSATADDGLFEISRGGGAQNATPAVAKLRGVRYLVSSELEERARIDAAFMKRMTGGDRLSARFLYGQPFDFAPAFTAFMVTNFLPKLPPNDPATWARVRVTPFDVVIPKDQQDPHLGKKLEAEADAVLTWAVEGWFDYQANGLAAPNAVLQATQEYAESQDDVRRFIEAWCEDARLGGFVTTRLHNAYKKWAMEEGVFIGHVLGKTKFAQRLTALGYPSVKSQHGNVHALVFNTNANPD